MNTSKLCRFTSCFIAFTLLVACKNEEGERVAINHIRKDFGYSGKMDLIGRSESAAVESVEIFKIKSDDFRSFDEMIKSQSVPASETEEIRRAKKGLNLAHVSDGILIGSKLLGVIRKESYTIVVLKKDDFYFIFYLSGV